MKLTLLVVSCLAIVGFLTGCKQEPPQPTAKLQTDRRTYPLSSLKTVEVMVGRNKWAVWVMDDEDKRREGLMYAKPEDLTDGKGMLFVFPDAQVRSFWMQNTEIALDIAFFGPDKKLLNVQRGIPFDETSLPSDGPAQYVLEVKEGTFDRLGIKKGARLEILGNLHGR